MVIETIDAEVAKKKILDIMHRYYYSMDRAVEWYETRHGLLSIGRDNVSPKDMVERGQGQEVLDFLHMIFR